MKNNIEWSLNIHRMIEYFSDINRLSNAWYGLGTQNSSCFEEDLCILFDDLCFDDFIDFIKDKDINQELQKSIIMFHDLLSDYRKPQSDLALDILSDPKFEKIVDQAKKVISLWDIYLMN